MQYQWSIHIVRLRTFQMNFVESCCWVGMCCLLTKAAVESCITLCGIYGDLKETDFFFCSSHHISLSFHECSIEVTDQCVCNRSSLVCLHGVHRDSFTFNVVLLEWLQYLRGHNSVLHKLSAVWSHRRVCHSRVMCHVKTKKIVI